MAAPTDTPDILKRIVARKAEVVAEQVTQRIPPGKRAIEVE